MFLGLYGYTHISTEAAQDALKKAIRKAVIRSDAGSFRALRHSFATHLFADGVDT